MAKKTKKSKYGGDSFKDLDSKTQEVIRDFQRYLGTLKKKK